MQIDWFVLANLLTLSFLGGGGSSTSQKLPANHETAVIGRWLWQMAGPIDLAISQNLLTRQLIWSLSQVLHNKAASPAFLGISTTPRISCPTLKARCLVVARTGWGYATKPLFAGQLSPSPPMQHLLSICFCVEANALYFAALSSPWSAVRCHGEP